MSSRYIVTFIYFIRYKYSYSHFSLNAIYLEYHFPPSPPSISLAGLGARAMAFSSFKTNTSESSFGDSSRTRPYLWSSEMLNPSFPGVEEPSCCQQPPTADPVPKEKSQFSDCLLTVHPVSFCPLLNRYPGDPRTHSGDPRTCTEHSGSPVLGARGLSSCKETPDVTWPPPLCVCSTGTWAPSAPISHALVFRGHRHPAARAEPRGGPLPEVHDAFGSIPI